MKKFLILIVCTLFLTGCGVDKELKENYENMKIGENTESYQLDLRIYGSYDNRTLNEIIKVDNYKNTQFKIDYVSNNNRNPRRENEREEPQQNEEEPVRIDNALYIIDGTKYRYKEGKYQVVEEETLYTNTDLYLKSLNNVIKKTELEDEKIGEETYKVYEIIISKGKMEEILKSSVLSKLKLTKDVRAKVWIKENGQVSKIVYYLTESKEDKKLLEISASYFRINLINDMSNIVK
jgi:hypothetical protein